MILKVRNSFQNFPSWTKNWGIFSLVLFFFFCSTFSTSQEFREGGGSHRYAHWKQLRHIAHRMGTYRQASNRNDMNVEQRSVSSCERWNRCRWRRFPVDQILRNHIQNGRMWTQKDQDKKQTQRHIRPCVI